MPAYVSTCSHDTHDLKLNVLLDFATHQKSLQVNQHHTDHSEVSLQKQNLLLAKMHKFATHVLP